MSYPMFVPNFKILSVVVPENSLTEKKVNTHTNPDKHCYGKDENYIPPYTSYAGGIITCSAYSVAELGNGFRPVVIDVSDVKGI